MQIITTHLHADFDCLASMVAAQKLYPSAKLVFPGSAESNVRRYLEEHPIAVEKLKGFNRADIDLVVMVDASSKERIGSFATLADSGNVRFHLFDHHGTEKIDIDYELGVIRQRGSTVTIFTELFREKNIDITAQTATLLMMGLYEDTGSLAFSSVTQEDFEAGRWLFSKGADLEKVARFIKHEMNREQVELLNALLKNQESRNIKGNQVTVTHATNNRYIGDVSAVVHSLLDIEPCPALFALIRLEDRIHLVARSLLPTVNSSKVAGDFGGGGHLHASAATIKGETLPDTIAKLWKSIGERSDQAGRVGDLMNRHVKTVTSDETAGSALTRMIRYGITVMPLVENALPVALLKRSDLDKAIHHGFEKHPVWEFADNDFESLFVDSPVQEAERIIFSEKQKQIPILSGDGKSLEGIVTRSTILSSLYEIDSASAGRFLKGKRRKKPLSRDVTHMVKERVAQKIVRIFKDVVTLSKEMDCKAYAVGGFVRDLLMNNRNLDVDIVVEGDGISFARKLADRLGARVRVHEKFATAVIIMKDGYRVDVATARVEFYDSPAALPNVEMSGIKKDLSRRDFSMNAMAVELSGNKGYRLIDHFGGQADIKDKAIRVLHNVSFIEDPTRAFRAVRFEGRFGFKIGRQTLALIKNALRHNLMDRLSGKRLFHELKLILSEKRVIGSLYRLDELGLLKTISPELVFDEPMADLFERCEELITWFTLAFPGEDLDRWQIRFMALVSRLGKDGLVRLFDRFPEYGNILGKMKKCHQLEKKISATSGSWGKWETYLLLEGHDCDEIIFISAKTDSEPFRRAAVNFLVDTRFVKADLTGKDLIELGYKPSAEIGEILKELLRVKLTGEVHGKKSAIEYVHRYSGSTACHSQK